MTQIVFSSSELPEGLSERQKLSRFQDLYSEKISTLEMYMPTDIPFSANCILNVFDSVVTTRFKSTIQKFSRASQHIATKTGEGAYQLNFNVGSTPWSIAQRKREMIATETSPIFTNCSETIEIHATGESAVVALRLPRGPLLELIANVDDHILRPFDPASEPLRYLRQYLKMLNAADGTVSDPAITAHIRTTLLDLAALTLGARHDSADLARRRGLRAARLRETIEQIERGFTDPSFSIHHVAQEIGVTPQSIQRNLQETGLGFVDRVMELRLQKARKMLMEQKYDHLKIEDLAQKCGFTELSYFHRRFRRRFGDTPGQFRRRDS